MYTLADYFGVKGFDVNNLEAPANGIFVRMPAVDNDLGFYDRDGWAAIDLDVNVIDSK